MDWETRRKKRQEMGSAAPGNTSANVETSNSIADAWERRRTQRRQMDAGSEEARRQRSEEVDRINQERKDQRSLELAQDIALGIVRSVANHWIHPYRSSQADLEWESTLQERPQQMSRWAQMEANAYAQKQRETQRSLDSVQKQIDEIENDERAGAYHPEYQTLLKQRDELKSAISGYGDQLKSAAEKRSQIQQYQAQVKAAEMQSQIAENPANFMRWARMEADAYQKKLDETEYDWTDNQSREAYNALNQQWHDKIDAANALHDFAQVVMLEQEAAAYTGEITAPQNPGKLYRLVNDKTRWASNQTRQQQPEGNRGADSPDAFMSETQRNTFNYLAGVKGEDAAEAYYALIKPQLEAARSANTAAEWAERTEEHPYLSTVTSVLMSPLKIPAGLASVAKASFGVDVNTNDVLHQVVHAQNAIRQTAPEVTNWTGDATIFGQDADTFIYGTITSALDSALNMVISGVITGAAGAAVGGFTAGQTASITSNLVSGLMGAEMLPDTIMQEKAKGRSDSEAVAIGIIRSLVEAITEKYSIEAFLGDPRGVAKRLEKAFIAEGSEEVASNWLNRIVDIAVKDPDNLKAQYDRLKESGAASGDALTQVIFGAMEEDAGSFLAGGISGLAMGGAAELADYTQRLQAYTQKGQQILDSGNYDTLQALAMDVAKEGVYGKGESELSRFAEKTAAGVKNLNENYDDMTQRQVNRATRDVGKLADRVDTVRMRQNAADIQSSLEAKGMSARDAKKAAQLISENYEGLVDPEDKDLQRVMAKPEVRETMKEIADDSNSSVAKRNYRYNLGLMGLKLDENGVVVPVRSKTEEPAAESVTMAEADKNASVEISDGVSGKVQGIKWDNGILTATVTTEAGETVSAPVEDVSMPREMQDLVAVSKQFGESAPAVYAAYQPGMGVAEYGAAMKLASDYGYTGVSRSYAYSSEYLNGLHPAQISIAYEAGQAAWTKESTETMRTQSKGTVFANRKAGKVSMKGGTVDGVTYKAVDRSGMTAQQKAAVRNIARLAQVTGINFVFYQSEKNSAGKYSGANGIYTDNTIFLDINAGATDSVTEAAILRTAAHELTHFIEQFSKSEYRALQEFMLKNLEGYKGKTIDQLVAEKQARSKKDMRFQDAMSEIVADGCEMMLQDTRIMELLASEHEGIAKKISRWLKNWVEDLKAAFTGVEAVHEEARAMIAHAEELQKLWDNALMQALRNREQNYDASSNYQEEEKNTTKDGGEMKYSQRYLSADTNSEILSMVDKVSNGDFKANEKVYLGVVSDTIADQINKLTGLRVNGFKVAIEARQIDHILKEHGINGGTDHSMADPDDIAKMEYVLSSPDDIRNAGKTRAYTYMRDGRNRTADTVLYEKQIGDKSYYVVQAVPDTKAKTLYIVTAFIGKSGYKKEASQLINAKSSDVTAKTGSANASIDSIRNNGKEVKSTATDDMDIVKEQGLSSIVDEIERTLPKTETEIAETEVVQADRDLESDLADAGIKYSERVTDEDSGVKYSYRGVNDDGIEVYETSEEVKRLSYKERQKRFLEIMTNEYRGKTARFVRNGHTYFAAFDEKDVNKNIYGDNKSDTKGWKAKINVGADGDIFELVENARYNGSRPETGKKIAAHRGVGYWDYFVKTVQIDNTVFDLLANVRKKADGAFVYSIQLVENKKKKASPPLGSLLRASSGVTNAFDVTVPQPDSGVKLSDRDPDSVSNRYQDRDYSYEALTSKPDMNVTLVDDTAPKNRADVVAQAKKNAAKIGRFDPKTGSVSVHVNDISGDVLLGTDGLKHGLRRTKDAQRDPSFIVTIKAGEIIQNSIRINEATPKKETATGAYVLIGAAQNKDGDLFIVRSMVNQFSNELDSIDVLYSINTKKELAATKSPRSAATPLSVTSSTISISDLLDYVNKYFPDILPEEVLKHYGYSRRPEGDFGDDMLFQDRDTDSISNRSLLANALESAAQNDIERNRLEEYRGKIDLLNSEEQKLQGLRSEIRELSFAKGPKDTKRIKELQFEANKTANRINIIDRQLLRLEAAAPLQNVLQREKKMAYKRAEQKGKEALAAYREKATKTQREIISRYQESRAKGIDSRKRTAMRGKIQNVVNELNQYLLNGNKDKRVMMGLKKAVAEALDAVNMDTVGAEERIAKLEQEMLKAKTPEKIQDISRKIDNIREMGDRMSSRLEKLKAAYAEIRNSDDPLIANAHDEVIEAKLQSVIESVGDTPLRDMTLSQLEDVYDMYRMVLTNIRNSNKAFKAAKSQDIAVLGNNVMMEIEEAGGKKKYRLAGTDGISRFDWNNLKPVYAFERIGSKTFSEIFSNVRTGEDTWALDVTEAKTFSDAIKKKYGYKKWNFDQTHSFQSTSGMEFNLNLEQIMSLYAYSKRDQALDHLQKGGIVFDPKTQVVVKTKAGIKVKYNLTEATAYNISEATLADIVSKLTPEQKSFVDEMQDYLSTTMGEKGNEVSLELYGIKLFREKFYFPLKSASQFMAKAKEQQQGEVKIKNSGFSKETVQKANNPIVLSGFMDVWASHVNEMSMYHAFVLPMEDFYRVYNYRTPTSDTMATESVEMFLQNAYGKGATQYIDQLLKDLNGGARSDPRESAGKALVGRFKKAAVFASASVVIQQPSAIGRALALINPKYFDYNPKLIQHKKLWAEVKKYAPVAIIKEMGYFDTDMGMSTVDYIKGDKSIMDKADEWLSKAPALADELTWCHIWTAVKRETLAKNKGMDIKSDEFLQKVGKRFTEVIVKTQVYDSVLSRSANMRSKRLYMNMITSFMAEPTTSFNMLQSAAWDLKRGYKGKAAQTFGSVMASVVLNALLVSLVYAARDDDEDETLLEKYFSSLATELVDGINPITYIPIAKDIWSLLQGYDVERADMSLIATASDALEKLIKVASVDTSDMDDEALEEHGKQVTDAAWGLVDAVMSMTGIPVKNARRYVTSAINTYKTVNNGLSNNKTSFWNEIAESVKKSTPVWIWLPDKKKGDKLYEAIVSGDKSYQERIESLYDSQNAIDSARVKALRDNDPRILEAATAAFNGDPGERVRIAREIIAEGHFSQDDVIRAINAEINKLERAANGESESEKSSPKLYDMNDYYDAIMIGDKATADDVKEYYLDERIAQGDSEEDALNSFESSFTSTIKSEYLDGNISRDKVMSILTTYGGSSESEAETSIKKWDFEDEYGYSWDQRDNAFRLGDITMDELVDYTVAIEGDAESAAKFLFDEQEIDAGTAADMLVTYSGMELDDAENKAAKWGFKNAYGYSYDDRREAYISGAISASDLKKYLMDLGGMTSDEADLQIQVYDWEKDVPGCDDITASAIRDYDEYCYGVGISKRVYYDAWSTINDYEADYDENGNAIKDSRVIKVMPYINSLPLTADQKTAIALCFWKSKTVSKYRLW